MFQSQPTVPSYLAAGNISVQNKGQLLLFTCIATLPIRCKLFVVRCHYSSLLLRSTVCPCLGRLGLYAATCVAPATINATSTHKGVPISSQRRNGLLFASTCSTLTEWRLRQGCSDVCTLYKSMRSLPSCLQPPMPFQTTNKCAFIALPTNLGFRAVLLVRGTQLAILLVTCCSPGAYSVCIAPLFPSSMCVIDVCLSSIVPAKLFMATALSYECAQFV